MTHTTTPHAVRAALPAAAALLLATAVPAHAAPREAARGDWLFVTVTTGDARSSDMRGTLLLCDPPQGHGRAAEACAQLETAAGDIPALSTEDTYCPMVHAPVTAHAYGEWHGRPVDYTETFSNKCVMGARTGAVFALDG
ncbi:SSI family serine proteinase inhibitor [Streptomyces sp. NPDC050619]|uniref:SSI family serine proteinase inhibitor n=1 Tax=Streptomyces sp. NPDC050619 TaxID=3157214 RepID=UPI003422AA6B